MAKKVFDDVHIAYIADAIRRSGSPENYNTKYTTAEMEQAIVDNVAAYNWESGFNSGYNTGEEDGYNVGYTEGEVAGKQEEGLAFWKAITNNGARTSWDYAFAYTDYSEFEFKKPIAMKGDAERAFRMYKGVKLPRKEYIDMSGVSNVTAVFSFIHSGGRRMTIPDYGIPAMDSYAAFCDNAQVVETIEIIRCHEGTTFGSTCFVNCHMLKNITFEGVIGANLSMQYSPLSVASLKNIITHLKDYTGINEYGYTLTLKSSAFSSLEAEGATAEYNGVPCTWAELIDNKKWNLTLAS